MKGIGILAGMILAACASQTALPQPYPNRPVRIVSPLPAGGPVDALARVIGQTLSEALGQPFVVENRPGANTQLAARSVAEAPADGYTLMMATDSTFSINPHLYARLPYDPADFAGISELVSQRSHLFVHVDVPVRSVRELVAYAKSRPGQLNYGTYGHGSSPHLSGVRFARSVGIDVVPVPFKGSQDSMLAFASGQLQMMIVAIGSGLPLVKAGKIRPLAVTGAHPPAELPDTPTFAAAGYPDLAFGAWFGLVARKATPAPIIQMLSEHLTRFTKSPRFSEVAGRYAWDVIGSTAPEFDEFLVRDRQSFGELIKDARIEQIN